MSDFDNFPHCHNSYDFEDIGPGEYTYDFDYTYTFSCKSIQPFSEGFRLFPPALLALQALPTALPALPTELTIPSPILRCRSVSFASSCDEGGDSPYPASSSRSNLSRRYSSSSYSSSYSSSSSSGDPSTMNTNYIASIGTHMYDNPGTISSATTAYVSRERLAALEYIEKNISTIISEQVRKHYDGYTGSSIPGE